ncbi:hypothetical protein LCGC14_2176490 [marine sediment metagenome]|uniref:Peptidase M28 domain-containing protein n=1 Tax=marine sediment metagenome TaxID=412755 RepID=A0A0F9DNI4_9ZZZZ
MKQRNVFSTSTRKRIANLICPSQFESLRESCLATIESFAAFGDRVETKRGPFFFQDNGADVLAVAHLDTVRHDRHFGHTPGDDSTIYNCQLDDRLGVWLALYVFPVMGLKMDVLLTTGEESARSTAKGFVSPRQYNWLTEFDRSGVDVVTYDIETTDWSQAIEIENCLGWGSYSDIVELEHLGACAANWGVGYYGNHEPESMFRVRELGDMIHRFKRFYDEFSGVSFPYDPSTCIQGWEEADWEEYDQRDLTEEDRIMEEEWREYFLKYGNPN